MNVQLVRHATLLLDSSHGRILVDPMLRAAGTSPPIENTPNPKPNPLVELPFPGQRAVLGVALSGELNLGARTSVPVRGALLVRAAVDFKAAKIAIIFCRIHLRPRGRGNQD